MKAVIILNSSSIVTIKRHSKWRRSSGIYAFSKTRALYVLPKFFVDSFLNVTLSAYPDFAPSVNLNQQNP